MWVTALIMTSATPVFAGSWFRTTTSDTVGSGVWDAQPENTGYSSPHGGFSTTSNLCKTCHAVHGAGTNSYRLLKDGSDDETRSSGEWNDLPNAPKGVGNQRATECMYCHDANSGATSMKPYELTPLGQTIRGEHTLGVTDVPDSNINNVSSATVGILGRRDPAAEQGAVLQCWQCHSVHGANTIGSTNAVEGSLYNASDAVESWNTKILRLDPAADGSVLAKGSGGLSVSEWQGQLNTDGGAVRTGFCADCHNLNPNWEVNTDDTTRPNPRSHVQGPGTDSEMEVYGVTMTVAAHPLEEVGCRGCHYATAGSSPSVSRFPHQSVGWKLLFDEATMTGGTSDLAGDPQRIIPGMDNVCLSCHAIFEALDVASGTGYCLRCHDSKYGAADIGDEIRKTYGMGIQDIDPDNHTPDTEISASFADGNRHARCDDCHNAKEIFPWRDTPLTGMWGATITAWNLPGPLSYSTPTLEPIAQVGSEKELCFKCHSLFTAQPLSSAYKDTDYTDFMLDNGSFLRQDRKAMVFSPANSSYHPIMGAGRNQSINLAGSLQAAGLSTSSILKCTDCHNNNVIGDDGIRGSAANFTGNEPTGPHGSDNPFILRASYNRDLSYPREDHITDNGGADLCFSCHDKNKLLYDGPGTTNFSGGDASPQQLHWFHMFGCLNCGVGEIKARCGDCHYNVHGNMQANNTEWGFPLFGGGSAYLTSPPRYLISGLVNFAPHVLGTTRPKPLIYLRWNAGSKKVERTCILGCHDEHGNQTNMDNWYGSNQTNDPTYTFSPLFILR